MYVHGQYYADDDDDDVYILRVVNGKKVFAKVKITEDKHINVNKFLTSIFFNTLNFFFCMFCFLCFFFHKSPA